MSTRAPAHARLWAYILGVMVSGLLAVTGPALADTWRHHHPVTCPSTSTTTTTTTVPATTAPPTTRATTTTVAPTTTTTVPSPSPSYPTSWSDFPGVTFTNYTGPIHPTAAANVSIVDPSGNPSIDPSPSYNGYTVDTFRIQTREGPRAAGGPITLNNGYIEVKAQTSDHSDGVQFYGGDGATITNTKILAGGYGATGIFAADNSHGTITLDGDYFGALPGAPAPGYLVRINSDGADKVIVRNTVFERSAPIAINPALVAEWTNVHYTDGAPVPLP